MRPIKFRAYDIEKKIMIDDYDQTISDHYNVKLGDIIHNTVWKIGMRYKTLMQFTGLHDKNGTQIFEGDIVKQIPYHLEKSELIIVEFIKFEKCGGCPYQTWGMGFDVGEYEADHLEIIGNLHEHSELLGKPE